MSKKGLSVEEKKARMLDLFHARKDFFQLKELEKLAPKEKGIAVGSVKDVVQALVDDGSVDSDKIGGSIYFWAFPSKLVNIKKRKMDDMRMKLETSSKKLKLVDKCLQEAQVGKEDVDNTTLQDIDKLEQQKDKLQKQLQRLEENNPHDVNLMKQEIEPVKDAANRWTDNIFAVKSWCKKKFMIEDKILNKQFGIPEDLDYLP